MRVALVVLVLSTLTAGGLGACEEPERESGILINVQRESGDFEVDAVEIRGYPDGKLYDARTDTRGSTDGQPLPQSFNLFVWIPASWIGQTVWLDIAGFHQGVRTSHGQSSAVPVNGRVEEVTILLKEGAPPCGNGIIDAGEQCEATDLAGQSCANVTGLAEGDLQCTGCQLDTSACHDCGNGVIEDPAEACDGSALADERCDSLGFVQGELRCGSDCQYDLTRCEQGCGNGVIEDDEVCDGTNLDGQGCPDFSYQRGYLLCDETCQFDTTHCEGTCGDGVLDPGESCDSTAFGVQTCLTAAGRNSGPLACTTECHLDVSGCYSCGDGAIEGPEQCDGFNLGGQDCLSVTGLPNGALTCDATSCLFNVSDCQ